MFYSKCVFFVLFLASMNIVNNNCDEKRIELQKKLIQTANNIPTLELNYNEIPSSDITTMLYLAEHDMNGDKPESFLKKLESLKCSYGIVTLYLLYHLINIQYKGFNNELFVDTYSECMHHMLQVMYLADGVAFQEMWVLTITLDGLKRNELAWRNINFMIMANSLMGFLTNTCSADQFSIKFLVFSELTEMFDFDSHNNELLTKLMLSDGHQGFMADFYRGDDRFEIYQFFWDEDRDYTNFAPPAKWFPSYKHKRLQNVYEDIALKWKYDFYSLTLYTDIIRNLILTVTYHALLRHCYYLQATWYIVFERVKAVSSPSKRHVMQDYCMKLVQIPLFSVENIFRSIHVSSEDIKHLKEIKCNLTNYENTNRNAFNQFVTELLKQYNSYSTQFDLKQIASNSMKQEFSVPQRINLSIVKKALLEIAEELDNYYKTVKCTLYPTRFRVVEYFKSTKPECDNLETPQDPNMLKSISTSNVNEYYQDLEVYKQFLRTLNLIPTLRTFSVRISQSELQAMIDVADKEIKLQKPQSYVKKIHELNCMYGEAALYIYYHVYDLFKNDMMTELYFYVNWYSKYIHRILTIMYTSRMTTLRGIWTTAILLDSIRHGKMEKTMNRFNKAMSSIVGPLYVCFKRGNLINVYKSYDQLVEEGPYNFVTNNDKLLSRIMLIDGFESFMIGLYRGEERFDVYGFFWNDNQGYTNFAPPTHWFPTYNEKYLREIYIDISFQWKVSPYMLLLYKDSIKNLVLMVTYYALIMHCRYLHMNWHIISRQIKSVGSYVQDDCTTLMQIPLALVERIFWYMNVSSEDMEYLRDIKYNLANYWNPNQEEFNEFVKRLLKQYDFYASEFGLEQMAYSKIKENISIPGQTEFSALRTTLFGFAVILDNYFETVKRALLPTTIRAIEYFTSMKPSRFIYETIQLENERQTNVIITDTKELDLSLRANVPFKT